MLTEKDYCQLLESSKQKVSSMRFSLVCINIFPKSTGLQSFKINLLDETIKFPINITQKPDIALLS